MLIIQRKITVVPLYFYNVTRLLPSVKNVNRLVDTKSGNVPEIIIHCVLLYKLKYQIKTYIFVGKCILKSSVKSWVGIKEGLLILISIWSGCDYSVFVNEFILSG